MAKAQSLFQYSSQNRPQSNGVFGSLRRSEEQNGYGKAKKLRPSVRSARPRCDIFAVPHTAPMITRFTRHQPPRRATRTSLSPLDPTKTSNSGISSSSMVSFQSTCTEHSPFFRLTRPVVRCRLMSEKKNCPIFLNLKLSKRNTDN